MELGLLFCWFDAVGVDLRCRIGGLELPTTEEEVWIFLSLSYVLAKAAKYMLSSNIYNYYLISGQRFSFKPPHLPTFICHTIGGVSAQFKELSSILLIDKFS